MSTTSLADFLLVQYDAEEQEARAAISATGAAAWEPRSYRVATSDSFEVAEASVPSAAFIARHDPARVLAECAAKRAIVDLHREEQGACVLCQWDSDCDMPQYGVGDEMEYPCPTLLALAQPYADAPGFDAAWSA